MKPSLLTGKTETIKALNEAYVDVSNFINELGTEELNQKEAGKWSSLEQVEHLILSSMGVASVLNKPKVELEVFGLSQTGSMTYEALYAKYKAVLGEGLKAPARFSPDNSKQQTKEELIKSWDLIRVKFTQRIEKWSEQDLDLYRLPHPALGKITIREMLYFTIFHTQHHLSLMKKVFNGKYL